MAYGTLLKIAYYDLYDQVTEIFIDQDGYSGSVTTIDGDGSNDTIEIKWGDSGESSIPNIYGSQATIKFIGTTNWQYSYLYSNDARKHRVRFLKDSTLLWTGFISPENYSEPKIAGPLQIQVIAFDGLGNLKEELFVDSNGDPYTGVKTIREIANICFLKTGHSLNEYYSIPYLNFITNYIDCSFDSENFTGMTCYEVLQAIFPECRVVQRSAEWWVISNANLNSLDTNIPYKKYNSSGTLLSSSSASIVATVTEFEGDPRVDVLPAVKRLNVIQEYGYNGNILENGSFSDYDNIQEKPVGWVLTGGVTTKLYSLNSDGDVFVYIAGKQRPGEIYLLTSGMYFPIIVEWTLSDIKLSLNYALYGQPGRSAYMGIGLILQGTNNVTYYLQQYGDQSTKEIKYRWTTGQTHGTVIDMNFHWTSWTSKYPNGINHDKVEAVLFPNLPNAFKNFNINIPGIPTDGTLRLYLYVPYASHAEIYGSCWSDVSLELFEADEEAYATQKEITIVNNNNNNFVPEDLNLMVGDVPDITNNQLIYKYGLLNGGAYTTLWTIDGITSYTYAELVARIRASRQRTPLQSYQCAVLGLLPGITMAFVDAYNSDKVLLENGITYKDYNNTCDGRYTELLSVDLTAGELGILITETEESNEKPSGASSSSKNTQQPSKDERVILMGAVGQPLSSSGCLDGDYFEFDPAPDDVDDPDLGIPLFRPKFFSHVEANRITDLVSRSVTVTFLTPFTSIPTGIHGIKVYRWGQAVTGKWKPIDVRWYFSSSSALTTDGFSLEIEATESLTGVIVEYYFIRRYA